MAVRNIKLVIQYDGSDYSGWQIQPGKKTIQGELTKAIESLTGYQVKVSGASRTDAGVSALGQTAQFQIDSPIPSENFAKAITDRLPDDIVVTEAVEVNEKFDVISDVKTKLYRYTIFNGKNRPVLHIKHCWHIDTMLDAGVMNQAAQLLVGKKDFKSFACAADQRENSIRTIFHCDVTKDEDWIYVDVEGNGFLYNMVRNIVGTLVEIGRLRWTPDIIQKIIDAKDRTAAGPIAPAAGLCLMWIKY